MYTEEDVLADIRACVEQVNAQLPTETRIGTGGDAVLVGPGGAESLTLIMLLVEVEDAVARRGRRVDIVDAAVVGKDGPRFRTVRDLARWIVASQ